CERTLVNELQEKNIPVIHFLDWLEKENNKKPKPTVSSSKEKVAVEVKAVQKVPEQVEVKIKPVEKVPEQVEVEVKPEQELNEQVKLENIKFVDSQVVLGTGGTSFNEN